MDYDNANLEILSYEFCTLERITQDIDSCANLINTTLASNNITSELKSTDNIAVMKYLFKNIKVNLLKTNIIIII